MTESKNILVVANETVIGQGLIDAVKDQAADAPVAVHVICPQSRPKHGYVIYDETVREAAENRLAMTLAQLKESGISATGEVMDPDPYSAITDAAGEREYDAIIVSTYPETRSGWLRQDLIARVRDAIDVPVEHVVVDVATADETSRTLVVANQTVGGEPLIDQLKALAAESPHRFIVICPQDGVDGGEDAHERLAHTLARLEQEGLEAIGQVTHPDPYTAIQTALDFYNVDAIVISTFAATQSGWLRADLVGRVKSATNKPVHHVVSDAEEAPAQEDPVAEEA